MKNLPSVVSIIIFLFLLIFIHTPLVQAQIDCRGPNCHINIGQRQGAGGIPGIPAVGNPNATVGNLTANALQIIYIFAGLAVLFFFAWGAFDWVTAGGDKDKISNARRKIVNSLVGLTLLALSAFIVSLFGQVVGINPFDMGLIPTLGQQPVPRTTP